VIIKGRNVRAFPLALSCALAVGLSSLAISALPISAIAGTGVGATNDKATQTVAVKKAFTEALVVDRELGAPSPRVENVMRPLSAEKTNQAAAVRDGAPSFEMRNARVTRDKTKIDKHFGSGALRARENKAVASTMAAVADPSFRFFGGGVSQVVFKSVKLGNRTATIEAQADVWSKFAQKMPTGNWVQASPTAKKVYTVKLSMGPTGTWLVTDMQEDFAPGSGPVG
jgi:hypothetical protein